MVKPGPGHDPLLRRPFSVFEVLPDQAGPPRAVSLLNKRVGVVTGMLFEAEPGSRIGCLGPLGRSFALVDPPVQAWMVAGGVGLAPFATLADTLTRQGTPTTLFYGARRDRELFRLDLFERLGTRVVTSTEDGSRGEPGRVTVPLERALRATPRDTPVAVYACGPTPMLEAVARLAAAHGRSCQVSVEQVMACGLGGCYSCVVPVRAGADGLTYVRSCIEGPVFSGDEILWRELTH